MRNRYSIQNKLNTTPHSACGYCAYRCDVSPKRMIGKVYVSLLIKSMKPILPHCVLWRLYASHLTEYLSHIVAWKDITEVAPPHRSFFTLRRNDLYNVLCTFTTQSLLFYGDCVSLKLFQRQFNTYSATILTCIYSIFFLRHEVLHCPLSYL